MIFSSTLLVKILSIKVAEFQCTRVGLQPRFQGLSSNHPLGRVRRDPGLVWSRATLTIENIREGSSVIRQFVALSFAAL